MNLNLENKVAIVTGASKGIGKAIAVELAKEGCKLAICARGKEQLEKTAKELAQISPEILSVQADLTQPNDITKLVEQTIEKFGTIHILVNNAGTIGRSGFFDELDIQEWKDLFELNFFAVVSLSKAVIPFMLKNKWGRIINISSENGEQPYPDMPHYSVSKSALNGFTKMLSKSYAKQGILVNAVSPAFIKTPLVENMLQEIAGKQGISVEEAEKNFLTGNRPHIELRRAGTPDESAKIVAFLASDAASFINGSIYRVDGGSVAAI